jgi:hypothetical protein
MNNKSLSKQNKNTATLPELKKIVNENSWN